MTRRLTSVLLLILLATPAAAFAQSTVTVAVTAGESWVHHRKWKGVRLTTRPQMAFWLTDEAGELVQTLYVTRRVGRQSWLGGAFTGESRDEMRRPSALPVWGHARGVQAEDGVYLPTHDEPLPDAETGATPRGGFSKTFELSADLAPGTYHLNAEINQSLDYNDPWAADLPEGDPHYTGGEYGSGQPSLIYRATFTVGDTPAQHHLALVGHGHPWGADGEVQADTSTLTTALQIVTDIMLTYSPAP